MKTILYIHVTNSSYDDKHCNSCNPRSILLARYYSFICGLMILTLQVVVLSISNSLCIVLLCVKKEKGIRTVHVVAIFVRKRKKGIRSKDDACCGCLNHSTLQREYSGPDIN